MGALARLAAGMWRRLGEARARRELERQLQNLSPHLLADIGLRPEDVRLIVEGGLPRRRPGMAGASARKPRAGRAGLFNPCPLCGRGGEAA